jgi:hypothetical protein
VTLSGSASVDVTTSRSDGHTGRTRSPHRQADPMRARAPVQAGPLPSVETDEAPNPMQATPLASFLNAGPRDDSPRSPARWLARLAAADGARSLRRRRDGVV